MRTNALRLATLCAALGAWAAYAQTSPAVQAAAPAGADRTVVEQKAALLERMLRDSPIAVRINASGDQTARTALSAAERLFGEGRSRLQQGSVAQADQSFNEALWEIGKARARVPDPMSRAAEARVRYAQLLQSIESVEQSFERLSSRSEAAAKPRADLARVKTLVGEARALANAERIEEATGLLERTQRDLLESYESFLGTQPVVYGVTFSTAAEEYRYELERVADYESLVPLALSQFKPGASARVNVQQHVTQSQALQARAQQMAARMQHAQAVKALQQATQELQKALADAGLEVPQRMPN